MYELLIILTTIYVIGVIVFYLEWRAFHQIGRELRDLLECIFWPLLIVGYLIEKPITKFYRNISVFIELVQISLFNKKFKATDERLNSMYQHVSKSNRKFKKYRIILIRKIAKQNNIRLKDINK